MSHALPIVDYPTSQNIDSSGNVGVIDIPAMQDDIALIKAEAITTDANIALIKAVTDALLTVIDTVADQLNVNLKSLISGEDQANNRMMTMPVYTPYHYDTVGNKEDICSGAGVLGRVVINTPKAAATVTVYNGATVGGGTVIAIIDASVIGTYIYDADCAAGISLTLSDGDLDVTVLAVP